MIEKMCKPIKVCIVEDDPTYKDFLKSLLSKETSLHLYSEYSNGLTFLESLKSSFKPEVCLMDIKLPDISGIECAREVKNNFPDIAVIIMTSAPDSQTLVEARKIGADYIEKGTAGEYLLDRIILSCQGKNDEQFISLKVGEDTLGSNIILIAKELEQFQENVPLLSVGQRKIAILRQSGLSKDEIAERFDISHKTVQYQINKAEEKLKLKVTDNLFKFLKF